MDVAERELVRQLLGAEQVLALGVVVEGRPVVGRLPFAIRPDFSALLVHASRLARHSRGLTDGAAFSALVQASAGGSTDPFQVPRITLEGFVRPLAAESPEYVEGRQLFLSKLPSSRVTFTLGDFVLYELVPERARLVAGFGRARTLAAGSLRDLATSDRSAQTRTRGADE